MDSNCKYICTFNQQLSYDDLVNYFDYKIILAKSTKFFQRCYLALLILALFNLFFSIISGQNQGARISILALILIFIVLNLSKKKANLILLIIKNLMKKYRETKITVFENYILLESVSDDKKSYKILIKDIDEIEETAHYVLIKVKSIKKSFLISLAYNNDNIKIMLKHLHKVCNEKFNYNLTKQNFLKVKRH